MPNEFMTNKEAADYLRTSTLTLWRLRRGGAIPFYRIASKILYRRSDLDTFSEQYRRNSGGRAVGKRIPS
jgi:DNA binding domain, excisionase family